MLPEVRRTRIFAQPQFIIPETIPLVVLPARQAYSHWASLGNRNFPGLMALLPVGKFEELVAIVPNEPSTGFFGPLEG